MFTEAAQGTLTALGQATGGGLLVAGLAFVACRAVKKLTAPVRFWLWWLVGAKFLLGLLLAVIGVSAFRIPVIKAEHYYHLQGLARKTVAERVLPAAVAPAKPVAPTTITPSADLAAIADKPVHVATRRYSRWYLLQRAMRQDWIMAAPWLLGLYITGFLVCMGRFLRGQALVGRILSASHVCSDDVVREEAVAVAQKLRLLRCPAIHYSAETAVPFVVGVFRPVVVVPETFSKESVTARRMALAHEMAHVRRSDLLLDVVPMLLRTVFWFLPVAHYAAQEIGTAREEACDLMAVRVCETTPAVYASLLVTVAGRSKRAVPALAMATPASRGFRTVRRRLQTLSREGSGRPVPLFWRGVAGVLLVAQGAATLVPLRPALARAAEVARAVLPAPEAPRYVLTDLGTLGGKQSGAFAINDAGKVAGGANIYPLGSMGHAFLWDGDAMRDVNAGANYRHSQAIALSDNGKVAGFAYRSSYRSTQQTAYVWDGGHRIYLAPAAGYHWSRATGVSEDGTVVGASLGGNTDAMGATVAQATLWQNGVARDLGTLGGAHSIALAINDGGYVVGKADLPTAQDGSRDTHAFVYDPVARRMRDLQTLGGANSVACAINKNGIAVGYAETDDPTRGVQGVVWDTAAPEEKAQGLGSLASGESRAFAVSDGGDVVGQSLDAQGITCAVVWKRVTHAASVAPVDLNECLPAEVQGIWHLETARGVNSHGQIVGQGIVGGVRHAFLLTPINE